MGGILFAIRSFCFGNVVPSATTFFAVTLHFYSEFLRRKLMVPGCSGQYTNNLFDIEFNKLLAALAVEMTVGYLRYAVVAGDAIPNIDLLGQSHSADQFEIAPDSAVSDRAILLADFFIQLINRNVLAQFQKGAEHQLSLRGRLKALCS